MAFVPFIPDADELANDEQAMAEDVAKTKTYNLNVEPQEQPAEQMQQDQQAPQTEQPQEIQQEPQEQQAPPQKKGFTPFLPGLKQDAYPAARTEPKHTGIMAAFKEGLQSSATGMIERELHPMSGEEREQIISEDKSFWDKVSYEAGMMTGDFPFMLAGGAIGATLGASGGPAGSFFGGSVGTMAFPGMLKQAFREYRQFQEKGGDLTFGEFLQQATNVASAGLNEGMMGLALGVTKSAMGILKEVPLLKTLFDTKYVGPIAQGSATIAGEVGVATGIPAIQEGRLPTAEDLAKATVLFTAGRASEIPAQVSHLIKNSSPQLKYALADKVEKLNLAYPPLDEFKMGENPIYKNSVELDRNLAEFDKTYIENMASRINTISETEFPSAHDAGEAMKASLKAVTPEPMPEPTPQAPAPPRTLPLASNPLITASRQISPEPVKSTADLGRRITAQYNAAREAEYQPLSQRYTNVENQVKGISIGNHQKFVDQVQGFVDQFSETASPTNGEVALMRAKSLLRLMQETTEDGHTTLKDTQLSRIIATNRSLKKIPNWQVPPEMKDNMAKLTAIVDEFITGHLNNVNEPLAAEYTNLNADYHNFKSRFDNNDMKVFYDRTENSEAVAKKFTNLDEFTQLSQALSGTPQGDAILNLLRREAWEKGVGDKALGARTEAEFSKATEGLNERQLNDLMEYLTPEQRSTVLTAMEHSNQIRQSSEASARNYSQWKQNQASNKKVRQEVQTKQDLLVSLLKEDPAKLVGNMESIEGIRRMKEAVKSVPEGQQLYDALSRFETERMFDFMRIGYQRSGRVPYNEMKIQLGNKEFRAKLKELNGDKFLNSMDELVEVADQLSRNFKEKQVEYKDDQTTLNTMMQVYSIYGLANGDLLTPLVAFTAKKNILKLGGKMLNVWNTKKNLDPDFIKKTIEAGRAINNGSKDKIRNTGYKLFPPYKA
jgi:hypothetical protein